MQVACMWKKNEISMSISPSTDLPAPRSHSPSPATGHSASGAHVQLKRLVARVVEEAASLPALARYAAEPHTPSIESSTYEDLLATAILNKVGALSGRIEKLWLHCMRDDSRKMVTIEMMIVREVWQQNTCALNRPQINLSQSKIMLIFQCYR